MRVLLVDHDSEGLETITRAIRGVLELDCVTSKGDALLLLRQNTYDVLIACERCVDGSGLDLLGRTTRTAVPLKRIFAAAPERLQLLGPRLAPFKVQRTINYPIDLEELWLAIAQVTSGPNEETDGTIERVVLDERGIPSAGSSPRAPIPPRPPAPLREVAPPPPPAPAVAASAGRAAAARLTQPAPEPPLRAPPPPRMPPPAARAPAPPRTTSDTGRMRAPVPPKTTSDTGRMRAPSFEPTPPKTTSDTGRMRAPAFDASPPLPAMEAQFPSWEPEMPGEDELAEVAAQARFGVQQKVASEASRRRVSKVLVACAIAVVVAGTLVFAFEKFYDPAARAREKAIAQNIERMAEEQKVSDNLAGIEFDFETAITNGELDTARNLLATLIEKSPDHPRRDFLQKTLERETELAKLTGKSAAKAQDSAVASVPATGERAPAKPRAEKSAQRRNERNVASGPDRTSARMPRATSPRSVNELAPPNNRTYGAPIGDSPRQTIPLNAPINADPVTTVRRNDNAFAGRTVEETGNTPAPAPQVATTGSFPSTPGNAGSATVPMPAAEPPAAKPPAPVDVVPAKIVKRVAPVAAGNIPAKTKGFVVVRFNIGVNGRVSDLEVVESDPQGVFDDAAQDAVRKWLYEPRKENGVAVESTAKARLVFDAAN